MIKKDFNYVSPTATVKEMQTEGVLCMSFGPTSNNGFSLLDYQDGLEGW